MSKNIYDLIVLIHLLNVKSNGFYDSIFSILKERVQDYLRTDSQKISIRKLVWSERLALTFFSIFCPYKIHDAPLHEFQERSDPYCFLVLRFKTLILPQYDKISTKNCRLNFPLNFRVFQNNSSSKIFTRAILYQYIFS